MRQIQDFLANEWVAGGLLVTGVIITAPAWAHFLAILSAVGLGYGALARFRRCKPTPKKFRKRDAHQFPCQFREGYTATEVNLGELYLQGQGVLQHGVQAVVG
jgi:hypothetical protein